MLPKMRQCSAQSLGVIVEGVILMSSLALAVIVQAVRPTVGVLELVFWLHTHNFFGTLGCGVVQNDSIV